MDGSRPAPHLFGLPKLPMQTPSPRAVSQFFSFMTFLEAKDRAQPGSTGRVGVNAAEAATSSPSGG